MVSTFYRSLRGDGTLPPSSDMVVFIGELIFIWFQCPLPCGTVDAVESINKKRQCPLLPATPFRQPIVTNKQLFVYAAHARQNSTCIYSPKVVDDFHAGGFSLSRSGSSLFKYIGFNTYI
jgi:hypothetical protein